MIPTIRSTEIASFLAFAVKDNNEHCGHHDVLLRGRSANTIAVPPNPVCYIFLRAVIAKSLRNLLAKLIVAVKACVVTSLFSASRSGALNLTVSILGVFLTLIKY
uniref:Secreted protein n=1 Tax=Angiostrongylus cantonensis TaxID=6313 RepID=A0A0K0CYC9_ANGCA